nr:hypothetical protein [Legionella tunisiensis]
MANVFAAPFNGLLAERAQNLLNGTAIPERPFSTMVVQSIKRQGQFIFIIYLVLLVYAYYFLFHCFILFCPFYGLFLMHGC